MAWVASTFTTISVTLLALTAVGCTHPCLKLAEQICACEPGDIERESCEREMKSAFDSARVSELKAQASTCSELLDACDCHALDTEEGRQACGLARTP